MVNAGRVADIETTAGIARAHVYEVPEGVPRGTLALTHGAGTGIESWDLQLLASNLPMRGVEVVLFEQPWVVEGKKVAASKSKLDAAFRESVTWLRRSGEALRHLIVGGRSSGARTACRTVVDLEVDGVLCLSFPLHPPGKPDHDRSDELATAAENHLVTVIQGDRDPFGTPVELIEATGERGLSVDVLGLPWADHSMQLKKKAPLTQEEIGIYLSEATWNTVIWRRTPMHSKAGFAQNSATMRQQALRRWDMSGNARLLGDVG